MKSFFQTIGVIQKDESGATTSVSATEPVVTPTAIVTPNVSTSKATPSVTIAGGDANMAELLVAVRDNLQQNISYESATKYLAVLSTLKSIIPDIDTRVKAAIATSNIPHDVLLSSAQSYDVILKNEQVVFEAEILTPQKNGIIDLQTQVKGIDDEISTLSAKIQQLELDKQKLNTEIATADQQFQNNQATFNIVLNALLKEAAEVVSQITKNTTTVTV